MAVKIHTSSKTMCVIADYALQVGCSVNEKDQFWMNLGDYKSTISIDETLLLGTDSNKHVGKVRDDASNCHGNREYRTRCEQGERIIVFAGAHSLVIAYTYLRREMKTSSPSLTETQSQVEF